MTNQEAITKLTNIMHDDHYSWHPSVLTAFGMAVDALKGAEGDWISRKEAIKALCKDFCDGHEGCRYYPKCENLKAIEQLPSAQPERYTKEELRVFQHGISLSLLSKRSAQHWQYDENTATEIKFLERLYEKVSANMRGGQNE